MSADNITKFSITERMLAAINFTSEFCKTIGISPVLGYNIRMEEIAKGNVQVSVEIPGLTPPHNFSFRLRQGLSRWWVFAESVVTLSFPDSIAIQEIPEGFNYKNDFVVYIIPTPYGEKTTGFKKLEDS